ncbi:hypothetical protein MKX54_02290 [Alkalihalobacillus sp. FSL R5-0424]
MRRTLFLLVFSVFVFLYGCQAEDPNQILPEGPTPSSSSPPLLTVTIDNELIETTQGSYCWGNVCTDSEDPLLIEKAKDGEPPSFAPNSLVTLSYSETEQPDTLHLIYQTKTNQTEVEVSHVEQEFELPEQAGIYYYRTFASWESGGDISHAFRVAVE